MIDTGLSPEEVSFWDPVLGAYLICVRGNGLMTWNVLMIMIKDLHYEGNIIILY